jgi:hypothetical protein
MTNEAVALTESASLGVEVLPEGKMNKSWFSVLLGFFFVFALASRAETHRDFQTGKLLDVGLEERLVEGTTHKYATYEVQIGDVVYFARGERLHKNSGDAGHGLIVGDPVKVAIDGDNLILQRPDGKEIKAKITKRQRAGS